MILLIVVPDDFFHVGFFYHGIVTHEAGKNLNVVQGPRSAVLPVQEVGTDHGAKALFVLVADGDFVILIEHHPQIPVAAGARTVPRFLLFDKKRGREHSQGVLDEGENGLRTKTIPAGDEQVIGVAGVDKRLPLEIPQGIEECVIHGDHHKVCEHGRDGRALGKPPMEKAEIQRRFQSRTPPFGFADRGEGKDLRQHGQKKGEGGRPEEVGEIHLQKPPALVALVLAHGVYGTPTWDIGEGAGVVEGKKASFQKPFQNPKGVHQLWNRCVDLPKPTGLFGNMEGGVKLRAILLIEGLMVCDKLLQKRNQGLWRGHMTQTGWNVRGAIGSGIGFVVGDGKFAEVHGAGQNLLQGELMDGRGLLDGNVWHNMPPLWGLVCNLYGESGV